MIARQKVTQTIFSTIFFLRKELFIVLLIALSLGSGWYEDSSRFFFQTRASDIWQIKGSRDVKGARDVPTLYREQFREIEIIPVKYEKPEVTSQSNDTKEWGVAKQIGEHTWTMNVSQDEQMASPSDILAALNTYRSTKGRGTLSYDNSLSEYATERATFFASQNGMDSHAGFQDLISNKDGFNTLGFFALGENSSFGYTLSGTHLIEWVFAGDVPHDNNQLNPEWTHVGVGVNGVAVDIVFGGRKQ